MQIDSVFNALDSLKLPAALLIFAGVYYMKFINLEKKVDAMNIAKEDKTVVAQLANDFKGMTMRHVDAMNKIDLRHNEAQKKADQRARVHELTIVALAPEDQKHHVIADLKGD
jgi:hypothetical protein